MAKKKDDPADEETAEEPEGSGGIRIADHPRARRSIARTRAWGAVVGFAVAAYIGHKVGLTFVDLVIRAILIGCATSLAVWGGAIAVWRQIIFAEIAVRRKEAAAQQQELIEALQAGEEQRAGQPGQR